MSERADGALSDSPVSRAHNYVADLGLFNLDYEVMLTHETGNLALVDIFMYGYQESLSYQ